MPLHRWPYCLSLKSKWLPRYHDRRFQMSYKAFFSLKSPEITLRLGKCLIKTRIYCFLYLNLAFFFYELCDFPQIVWSDAIWDQFCEIAPSRNIRWPAITVTLGKEEGGHYREVTIVERLKQTLMYGLSAKKNGRCREVAVSGGSIVFTIREWET